MKIAITQFLRPDGRKRELSLQIPDEYQKQYDLINQCGCFITCEQLPTGEAAQYISHAEGDFDIRITPCSKAADKDLLAMISAFNKNAFDEWLKDQLQ